ncbi:MAG: shikimate dehydrogenase, partial [Chloroflexi bacterium]|nr:shikimate dehydrogenase [Chloroflexota bacterium]
KKDQLAKTPFDVLINATPIGMSGNKAPQILEPKDLANIKLVFDLVYNPLETPFLTAARAAGARTDHGLGMLVHQAALAFALWTGQEPPLAVFEDAARRGLAEQPHAVGAA